MRLSLIGIPDAGSNLDPTGNIKIGIRLILEKCCRRNVFVKSSINLILAILT